ncbi:NnrU family protein [Paracoccus sp. p4-l81]|uniref:NnrU family protein n=1 Tax=unclassified Paracoccus (in: a-proteobacteria) TaxID=2688777 RepID=UPI0035B8F544
MTDWLSYLAAFALFLAAHMIPTRPRIRGWLVARLGKAGYLAGYSLLSLGLLYLLILAAGNAPRVSLWHQTAAARMAVNLAMPVAILLAVLAVGAPNPLSFGGRQAGFDPDRPGLAGITRHPLLWALILWAVAHLIGNGEVAHVVLFAVMALFAAMGMVVLDARHRRRLGDADFARLTARAPILPLSAGWPRGWGSAGGLLIRLALAGVIWAGLLHLHLPLIGASPLP